MRTQLAAHRNKQGDDSSDNHGVDETQTHTHTHRQQANKYTNMPKQNQIHNQPHTHTHTPLHTHTHTHTRSSAHTHSNTLIYPPHIHHLHIICRILTFSNECEQNNKCVNTPPIHITPKTHSDSKCVCVCVCLLSSECHGRRQHPPQFVCV